MLTPQKQPKIEGIFTPRSPVEFLGFATVTGMLGLLSAGNPVGFVFVPVFAIAWWLFDRRRNKALSAATVFSVSKEPPRPAKGLILLISPYNPMNLSLKEPAVLNPLLEKVLNTSQPSQDDFTAINLLSSNLLPQIRAVDHHFQAGSLRDIWLISTESYGSVSGSEQAAEILGKYLRFQYGTQRLDIHREGLAVREYDYTGLWQLGEKIFRQSGYKDEVLVADVTGGNKMMSVAIAMACIPPGRRMQYMDSQRDWQGSPLPKGEMSPVTIDIDPILYQADAGK